MTDSRIETLATNLINYSCDLQKGEKILIEGYGECTDLIKALVRQAYLAGGEPFVSLKNSEVQRVLIEGCTEGQLLKMAEHDLAFMKEMSAYIAVRASDNINEHGMIAPAAMKLYAEKYQKPIQVERVNNTKWCVLRYPNHSMAQLASMPTDYFTDFYFNVCNLDYKKMSLAMDALEKVMNETSEVRITAADTDISFSIKGMPAIKCDGLRNIPDGEVYTAPIRDSVNGYITYNTPSVYQGTTFESIRFEFENGKIVKATSNNTEKLNHILDTDEGARYIGEFSLGLNPFIEMPMKDTLFDEKIRGSFHFTPGQAYEECDNGNKSAVHWDLVLIQRPDFGGGEIWFDDRLIRKDGLFVLDELLCLNPDAFI